MLIFGFRTSVTELPVAPGPCPVCGHPAAQALLRRTTKFSLFFIPILTVRTRYMTQCGACGATGNMPKAQARQLGA